MNKLRRFLLPALAIALCIGLSACGASVVPTGAPPLDSDSPVATSYYVPTPMPYPVLALLEADAIKWICGVSGLGYRLDGATYARISGIKFLWFNNGEAKIWSTSDLEMIAEIWDSFGDLSGNLTGRNSAIGGGYFQIQFENLNVQSKKTESTTVTMHGLDLISAGGINGRECMIELTRGAKTQEEWEAIIAKCELVYPVPEPGFAATYLGLDGIRAEDVESIEFARIYEDNSYYYYDTDPSSQYPPGAWSTFDAKMIAEVLNHYRQSTLQKGTPTYTREYPSIPLDIKINLKNAPGEAVCIYNLKNGTISNQKTGDPRYFELTGMMSARDWDAILEKCEAVP